ncbi:MAG: type II toxin-antitoxin system VapC family toxin [Vicinamibacterales bacterium]
MVAVDTNVLVYAHRREADEHATARRLLQTLAASPRPWAIAWPCVYEFFSVVTHPRIWRDSASTPDEAWLQLEAWFTAPTLRLLGETDGFAPILERFVRRSRVRGPVVHDARVAAICVAHGVESLVSRDRDFALFPELRVENPFA